jgi:hypothetical protein
MTAERSRRDESEQLPEEGPSKQSVDETGRDDARDEAEEHPGAADRDADSDASTGGAGAGD